MLIRKSAIVVSGAACIALAPPASAQSQQHDAKFGNLSCNQIQNDMRSEVKNLNLDQSVEDRVDRLLQQADQSRNEEQCLRSLRQANSIIGRETGQSPISSARFRQALEDASSSPQTGTRQAGDQRMDRDRTARSGSSMSESDTTRIPVTFSSNLIGRSVKDNRGESAGELEYLVVDTKTGNIRFAVIGSGGFLNIGQDLTAVPWEKVQVRTWGASSEPRIWLNVSVDKLEQGRRISENQLDQLANPSFQTQIVTFYLPLDVDDRKSDSGSQSSAGRRASSSQNESDRVSDRDTRNRSQQDRQARSDQTNESFDTSAKTPSDRQMDRSRESTQANPDRTAQGQADKQQQSARADGQKEQTLMLVGQGLVTTLAPSQLRTGQQIKGASVETSDGREVGEIDRLVIDVDRGKVAYALVAKGGFLGIGEEWRPVPLNALHWQSSDTYALGQGQNQLEKLPKLSSDDLPSRLRQGDLKKLYQAYGVQPYWQDGSRSSDTGTSRNRSSNQ